MTSSDKNIEMSLSVHNIECPFEVPTMTRSPELIQSEKMDTGTDSAFASGQTLEEAHGLVATLFVDSSHTELCSLEEQSLLEPKVINALSQYRFGEISLYKGNEWMSQR